RDLLDDLRVFERGAFGGSVGDASSLSAPTVISPVTIPVATPTPTGALTPVSGAGTPAIVVRPDSQTPRSTMSDEAVLKIVPKGLRSFDAEDRDFFLDLLPGPRDRAGLPDSIRFWKSRIEAADSRESSTFAVGVLYGPSGCGKSSLVKAGLLTHLASHVSTVYIESTGTDTESRLVKALRSVVDLPAEASVVDALRAMRQGQGLPGHGKVLLVLDQFEQWLHANRESAVTELARALRQCDGTRLQCLLLVRDDFWLAISRFLRELEVPLLQGENCAMADLFDLPHARRVLGAFGAAFGVLPALVRDWSTEQRLFVEKSVAALAQEGKVISVRLALFAEMVKSKPWTPATLQEVGGAEGVGITFLEETFGATTAPMAYRTHQFAVRGVLKVLLPEAGTDIKGHMIPREQLIDASGYRMRPHDFDALLRILDHDLRLITPVDAEGDEGRGLSHSYQLAHDYLVPSVREWLHKKQKETRRGRAELRLSERAAQWNSQPQNRYLPAWWEDLSIRLLTKHKSWTDRQRRMLRRSGVFHGSRLGVLVLVFAAVLVGSVRLNRQINQQRRADYAAALVQNLLVADSEKVPAIVKELSEFRADANPLLQAAASGESGASEADTKRQLHARLALLPVDDGQVAFLLERMLTTDPVTLPIIRDALQKHRSELIPKLWPIVHDTKVDGDRRFRAAAALASFDPPIQADQVEWSQAVEFVAEHLLSTIAKNPSHYGAVMDALRPVRAQLLAPLAVVFRDAKRTAGDHERVTTVLTDFAKERPEFLADLLCDSDPTRFKAIFDSLQMSEGIATAVRLWKAEIAKTLESQPLVTDPMKETLAKRQAMAAVALVRLGQSDEVWPLLRHSSDSRRRSALVHSFQALRCDPRILWERYQHEPDVTARRTLLLTLGEWALPGITPVDPQTPEIAAGSPPPFSAKESAAMGEALLAAYRSDPDVGLHGAAAWLLRQWGYKQKLLAINQELSVKTADQPRLATDQATWSINSQGQTLVRIPGPVEFTMGSPLSEPYRFDREAQARKRIGRTFEISAYEVTVEQFSRFRKEHRFDRTYARESDAPANVVMWYDAAAYCNWLSEQEGIARDQWCYDPDQKFDEGLTLPPDYLSRRGYRLPT
ncbi:MAG: SUMF1/EgtB/PvdO family nonheme iron enzyme, partial [Planctomycetaceae bacterium]|nr:SUMF1/EgtB/PvdO family nonheme iron enzyme [Planctomycetaceae bacterium]